MKKTTTHTDKLTAKQKAKLVKEQSRKHVIPPNKVQQPQKAYKRDKKVDPDQHQ